MKAFKAKVDSPKSYPCAVCFAGAEGIEDHLCSTYLHSHYSLGYNEAKELVTLEWELVELEEKKNE